MLKFSPSRYNVQQQCLGKYYYGYVLNKRDNTLWPGTVAGTATHLYLEENLHKVHSESDLKTLPHWKSYWERSLKEELESGANYKTPRGFSEVQFVTTYEKFCREVVRFLYLYLPRGKKVHEETLKESVTVDGVPVEVTGVVDLQVEVENELHVVDFKTTKNNATWYFVDWSNDAQSLAYYYLLRNKNPRSFVYTVFNFEQKTVLTQYKELQLPDVEEYFFKVLRDYVSNSNVASNSNNWNPSDNNCRYCFHKSYCPVAKK